MNANTIDTLFARAKSCGNSGDIAGAITCLKDIISLDPQHGEALAMLGQAHSAITDHQAAATYFKQASQHMDANAWVWYDYGQTLETLEHFNQATAAYLKAWKIAPENVRFPLFAGEASHKAGNVEQALHIWSIGADQDPMLRTAHQNPNADQQTQQRSLHADQELRRFLSQLHQNSLTTTHASKRLQTSLWPQTHDGPVNYTTPDLKPYVFYAPDLPPTSVYTNLQKHWPKSSWIETLQAASVAICQEYLDFMESSQTADQSSRKPYIDARSMIDDSYDHLKGQDTWTAVHLYKDGQPQPCLEHFPQTRAALKKAPLVYFHNQPMEVFFSILKPGIHIPAHYGLANTRLTAHLPLIIPKDTCRIRIGDHIHHWKEGELFLFDDSFNHEAWNDSEDMRVVLIFEAWRPDLTPQEIETIQTSFEDRDNWLKSRHIPELEI